MQSSMHPLCRRTDDLSFKMTVLSTNHRIAFTSTVIRNVHGVQFWSAVFTSSLGLDRPDRRARVRSFTGWPRSDIQIHTYAWCCGTGYVPKPTMCEYFLLTPLVGKRRLVGLTANRRCNRIKTRNATLTTTTTTTNVFCVDLLNIFN